MERVSTPQKDCYEKVPVYLVVDAGLFRTLALFVDGSIIQLSMVSPLYSVEPPYRYSGSWHRGLSPVPGATLLDDLSLSSPR